MTDRLQQASDRVHLARMKLQRLGAQDLEDAYAPRGQSYEVAVSGSGGESAPESAVTSGSLSRAGVAQQATRLMEKAASLMEKGVEQLGFTPTPAAGRCATETDGVRCSGEATHGRLCATCDDDWRTRRGLDIPVQVIKARNAKRTSKCGCHRDGCDHPPGVCVRDLEPGQVEGRCRTCREAERMPTCACGPECCPDGCDRPQEHGRLAETCKKRRDRARARQPAGSHPWGWHDAK